MEALIVTLLVASSIFSLLSMALNFMSLQNKEFGNQPVCLPSPKRRTQAKKSPVAHDEETLWAMEQNEKKAQPPI